MDVWSRVFWLVPVLMVGCSGTRPTHLGVHEGKLAPCPSSPNCVSTQSTDPKHRMAPIAYTSSLEEARDRVEKILRAMPRTPLVRVDKDKVIQFRSASRLGYSDLGVNRKRMEKIREAFDKDRSGS